MPPRVLVVDDNHDVADSTGALLSFFGCKVHICYDGASALQAAKSYLPDLCVLDISMPGMDGDELAVHIQDALPDAPIRFAALTALTDDEVKQRIKREGFSQHLVKPVEIRELMKFVGVNT